MVLRSTAVIGSSSILDRVASASSALRRASASRAERRRTALEALALRSAEEAVATRSRIELEPMTAVERKTIHVRLKEFDGVETGSEGTEPNRFVVILPTG